MLPEVNRRELMARASGKSWLQERGFSSIFEFAAKLVRLNKEQVQRVLQLERKFDDKPVLKESLFEGEAVPGHRIELSEEVLEKLYQLEEKGLGVVMNLQENRK